jgi:AcrR family transcriptional regulator
VHHFYGAKEALFVAAMELPVAPGDVLAEALARDPGDMGAAIVHAALAMWEVPETRDPFLGLLRSAFSNEQAATMLREFVSETILGRLAGVLDGPDAAYRAGLVGSQIVGLALARYVLRLEPVASAASEEIVAAVGPTIDRYLRGDLGAGAPVRG